MSNDVDVNPEIAPNGESPGMASRPYLNEMTQDVIEWDESKNMDLGQMFKSPEVPWCVHACVRGDLVRSHIFQVLNFPPFRLSWTFSTFGLLQCMPTLCSAFIFVKTLIGGRKCGRMLYKFFANS